MCSWSLHELKLILVQKQFMDQVLKITFPKVPQAFEQSTYLIYLSVFGIHICLLTLLAFKHDTGFIFQALT